jgi:hypothetical protein
MARIYKNITSAATTPLILKSHREAGLVNKILISLNDDSDDVTIELQLNNGSGTIYSVTKTIIPAQTTLVLDDNLAFDGSRFALNIITSTDGQAGGATIGNETTVIIT